MSASEGDSSRTEDLCRRLEGILSLAEDALSLLTAEVEVDGRPSFKREKLICETGLLVLCAAAAAVKAPRLREPTARLAERLEPHARSEEMLLMMRLRPAVALELSAAHVSLERSGFPDPAFRAELESLRGLPAIGGESVPWKRLERDWLGWTVSPASPHEASDEVLDQTVLGRGLESLMAPREELYAFTHALLYSTDFGRDPRPPRRGAAPVFADAEAALARCLDEDDFDLAAELLLTWPYLRGAWGPAPTFALSVLFQVEDEVGFLPALTLRGGDLEELEGEERRRHLLREAYHTAYVQGFLCAGLIRFGSGEPEGKPPTYAGATADLLSLLPPRQSEARWESALSALGGQERDRLASMIAAICLRRSIVFSDYRALRSVLQLCIDRGLPVAPPVIQASRLLSRLARQADRSLPVSKSPF